MNEQNVMNTPMTPPPPLLLTMDFQDESMMLNEGILDALGRPKQVQIMLNREAKRLLLMPCEVDSTQAVVMPSGHVLQAELGGRSLLKKIRKIAGWQAARARICIGEPVPEYNAVYFELENAIAVSVPGEGNAATGQKNHSKKPGGRKKGASAKKADGDDPAESTADPPAEAMGAPTSEAAVATVKTTVDPPDGLAAM